VLKKIWATALTALLGVAALGVPVAATADECWQEVQVSPGIFKYVNTCLDSGSGGTGAGGGSGSGGGAAEPTCTLTGLADYCIGVNACWANVPSAMDPAEWPEETRPSPDAIYTYQSCTPDTTLTGWAWYEAETVSVADLARQAFGSLAAPPFTLAFNPPGRAVVGLETWFWAATGQSAAIQGSPAMGVVAIGQPDRLEIDPGDGSGTVSCPWVTAESDACSHTYSRSSAGRPAGASGQPAYTARMRLVYDVRLEMNGAPLDVPGIPTTLESTWQAVPVPVAEVQSLVTR